MSYPEDFLPPELPPEYSVKYEGDSGSFEGQRYYRLHSGHPDDAIGLFYDHNIFWHTEKDISEVINFPSREAMYNWIVAQCALNLWSEK